jgi:hypothetical protein
MARIRSLKPSFWSDPAVADLTRDERLLLIGLISSADDEGRFLASASAISGYVFPHDNLPPRTVKAWRDSLAGSGVVHIYTVERREYGVFPKWGKHQRISKPQKSIIPAPEEA